LSKNPFASTLSDIDEPTVEGRPVSIDIQTAATFFAVAIPLSLIAYCIIRWLSHMLPSPRLLLVNACAAATMLGCVAAWRTWDRLSKVHIQRTQLRKSHEQALEEYSQRTSIRADKNEDSPASTVN